MTREEFWIKCFLRAFDNCNENDTILNCAEYADKCLVLYDERFRDSSASKNSNP